MSVKAPLWFLGLSPSPGTYLSNGANPRSESEHVTPPLDVQMAEARRQIEKWKTTLDWLAEH